MRCSPPMVRQYLYMRLQHDSKDMTYAETRDLILNYNKASVIWQGSTTQDGLTVVLDSRNDDPMGINRLWSESQKGKGKGEKGKDQKFQAESCKCVQSARQTWKLQHCKAVQKLTIRCKR